VKYSTCLFRRRSREPATEILACFWIRRRRYETGAPRLLVFFLVPRDVYRLRTTCEIVRNRLVGRRRDVRRRVVKNTLSAGVWSCESRDFETFRSPDNKYVYTSTNVSHRVLGKHVIEKRRIEKSINLKRATRMTCFCYLRATRWIPFDIKTIAIKKVQSTNARRLLMTVRNRMFERIAKQLKIFQETLTT